jgi:DNA-binding transcriptional ArsR family regulator
MATRTAPTFLGPISHPDAERLAGRMKVLADPTRLQIIALLRADGPAHAAELHDRLGSPELATVRHHVHVLRRAGLIVHEVPGWRGSLNVDALIALAKTLRREFAW